MNEEPLDVLCFSLRRKSDFCLLLFHRQGVRHIGQHFVPIIARYTTSLVPTSSYGNTQERPSRLG